MVKVPDQGSFLAQYLLRDLRAGDVPRISARHRSFACARKRAFLPMRQTAIVREGCFWHRSGRRDLCLDMTTPSALSFSLYSSHGASASNRIYGSNLRTP